MERARRRSQLRTWVVAGSVSAFVALWAGIFGQLASGHDPALSQSQSNAVQQAGAAEETDPAEQAREGSEPSYSSSPAPVTTAQS